MGFQRRLDDLKRELGVSIKPHYNINTTQFGEDMSKQEYMDFLKLNPKQHPKYKFIKVYSDYNGVIIVDALRMQKLHQFYNHMGYYKQTLGKNCDYKYLCVRHDNDVISVHSLVLESYSGRLKVKGESIHHIDHDKSNNHPDNLMFMWHNEHLELHRVARMSNIVC